jgi:hypothetical protein
VARPKISYCRCQPKVSNHGANGSMKLKNVQAHWFG